MDNYRVTILLATFNRAHLIEETLNSIKSQTYKNWECIIVDDHSIDETKAVIHKLIKDDPRFEYYLKTASYKKGLSGTRNYGLDLASTRNAKYIQFFDDDDIMHPKKLELQMQPFYNDESLDLTICQYRKFIDKSTIEFDLNKADDYLCNIKTQNLLESFFLYQINLNSLGPIWKSNMIFKYRFNEELSYGEERELFLRIFLIENIDYKPIPYVLFWYRKHKKTITGDLFVNELTKEESNRIIDNNIFNLLISQDKVSYPLIKAYTVWGIKYNNKFFLNGISDFIGNNSRLKNSLKYSKLYILANLFLIYRKMTYPILKKEDSKIKTNSK